MWSVGHPVKAAVHGGVVRKVGFAPRASRPSTCSVLLSREQAWLTMCTRRTDAKLLAMSHLETTPGIEGMFCTSSCNATAYSIQASPTQDRVQPQPWSGEPVLWHRAVFVPLLLPEASISWLNVVLAPVVYSFGTVGIFLNPLLEAIPRIRREGTVGKLPLLPYSTMFMNCMTWCAWGILSDVPAVWSCNFVGLSLGLYYTYKFCPKSADWLPLTRESHWACIALLGRAGPHHCYISADRRCQVGTRDCRQRSLHCADRESFGSYPDCHCDEKHTALAIRIHMCLCRLLRRWYILFIFCP